MSACYSPNENSELGFDLPFDLETGEVRRKSGSDGSRMIP
jgi:hypothetical protein